MGSDRDPACVERWPECEDGAYDPRCCRFPKPCSPRPPVTDLSAFIDAFDEEGKPVTDPTPLREALAEAIERSDGESYDRIEDVYLLNADAVLACLVEHRDNVLGLLGMKQVGWVNPDEMPADSWTTDFVDASTPGAVPVFASVPEGDA